MSASTENPDYLDADSTIRGTKTSNQPVSRRADSRARRMTSSCVNGRMTRPAARLVMVANARTRRPKARNANTSGTVDIPTASAPSHRKARISAGV